MQVDGYFVYTRVVSLTTPAEVHWGNHSLSIPDGHPKSTGRQWLQTKEQNYSQT